MEEAAKFSDIKYGAPPEAVGVGVGGLSGWTLTEAPFILPGPSFRRRCLYTRMSSHRVCAALVNDLSCGKYPNELWPGLWRGTKRIAFSFSGQNFVI